jgi:endonuclease I
MRKLLLLLILFPVFIFSQPSPTYYNSAVGKSDNTLRTTLSSIIGNPNVTSYSGLYTAYNKTDINPSNGKIWDMYSNCNFTYGTDENHGSSGAECTNYNREHTTPQSWFGEASPMVSDIFNVYPTDTKVNGMRGNYPYGEVALASYTSGNGSKLGSSSMPEYSGTVFEPINEFKGDLARTCLYMATCYAGVCQNWGSGATVVYGSNSGLSTYSVALFLKWHRQDPVSTKETNRNNAVYGIQGNRNPFIDYPILAEHIWGTKKGTPWSTTSGIDDLKIEFSVSPNPASKFLNVKTDEQNTTYRIISLNGMLVESKKLNTSGTISIEQLNDGMYFIELQMGNRKAIQKFVVNN